MTAPRLARAFTLMCSLVASSGWTSVVACSGPSSNELFAANSSISAGATPNAGGSASATAGTDSAPAPIAGGGTEANGGTSAASGSGGSAGSDFALSGGASGSGGQAVEVPVIESCNMLDGAVTNEQNGHCYRVNSTLLTFEAAREACRVTGGHLLTVTSPEENDFAHDLHDGEHWLGAYDGLSDTTAGVGSYAWVNDEAWDYADWRDGQPNAYETNCPEEGNPAKCFEHCAYQDDPGDWVDRSCWHTVASICEWEPVEPPAL